MKKFLLIVVSVVLLFACGPKPVTKVTGVVKKFDQIGQSNLLLSSGPQVTFEDGRSFVLKDMPEVPILVGSEIIIYYTGKNAAHLFNDSVVIVKEALSKVVMSEETAGWLDLNPGDFEILSDLIIAKGVKVTSSDNQYVYHDKFGNRHALIATRRTDNRADPEAPVSQISVWVNGKNAPEENIFFSYIIRSNGIEFDRAVEPQITRETINVIRETIDSLLAIAKKQ